MDFNFTEEQLMLKETAKHFIEGQCTHELVRAMEKDEIGYKQELWAKIAELGWLGIMIPEDYSGFGLGLQELVLVMEEVGAGCFPGPFLETTICACALLGSNNEGLKNDILPGVAAGEVKMSLAYLEHGSTVYDPAYASLNASEEGGGYVLKGAKMFVQYANSVDYFLVTARTSGPDLSEDGLSLFLVPAKSAGITMNALQTVARDRQYEVIFDGVKLGKENLVGGAGKGFAILNSALKTGAVAKAAEMVGGGQFVLDLTVNYSLERSQFGQVIGKFQAIQHHCSNMVMDLSGSRYITYKAAWFIDQGQTNDLLVAASKGFTSDAYRRICALGHQVGGGSAFMEEQEMQLYSRRAKAGEIMYGDGYYHRKQAAKAIGL